MKRKTGKRDDRDETEDDNSGYKNRAVTKAKVKSVAPLKLIMSRGKAACIEYFRQLSDEMKVQSIQLWTKENAIDDKLWTSMKGYVQNALEDYRNFLGDQFDATIDSLQYYVIPNTVTEMAKQALSLTCNKYQNEVNYLLNAFVLCAAIEKAKTLCNDFYLYKFNLEEQKKFVNSWDETGIHNDLWLMMKESVTNDLLQSLPQYKDNIHLIESILKQARFCAPNKTVQFEMGRVHQIETMELATENDCFKLEF